MGPRRGRSARRPLGHEPLARARRAHEAVSPHHVGAPTWDTTHETAAFRLTKGMYAKALLNHFAWWRQDLVAVPVANGVDEIALALTLDAMPRTMRGKAVIWSADGAPVTGKQGLK